METMPQPKKIGILTAGGLAPCLSSAVGGLIERYSEITPETKILCYRNGYQGLLLGDHIEVTQEIREQSPRMHRFGGSPIGNSRVKLTNVKDCLKRGLVKKGEDPQRRAAERLVADGVDVLHTIGGDDTNTAAAELAAFLRENDYELTVIGLPKTIDNDVVPIRQSLGAWTAAEEGARFFRNIVAEEGANPRMLIVHEVMGRACGWLTAATGRVYMKGLSGEEFLPEIGLSEERRSIHGLYIPEMEINLEAEAERLRKIMDRNDCVHLFISEGAGVSSIVAKMEASRVTIPRDAFSHVRLDAINPGKYFAEQFAEAIGAEKVMVQKSGYYARAAPPNADDLRLIKSCVDLAVEGALKGESGVTGHDEERENRLRLIEFERIRGHKPFDPDTSWFRDLLQRIGQPSP